MDVFFDLAQIVFELAFADSPELRWCSLWVVLGVLGGFASLSAPLTLAPDRAFVTWLLAPVAMTGSAFAVAAQWREDDRLAWNVAWGMTLGLSFALTRHLAGLSSL